MKDFLPHLETLIFGYIAVKGCNQLVYEEILGKLGIILQGLTNIKKRVVKWGKFLTVSFIRLTNFYQ